MASSGFSPKVSQDLPFVDDHRENRLEFHSHLPQINHDIPWYTMDYIPIIKFYSG